MTIRIDPHTPLFIYEHPVFTREINWAHHLMNVQEAWAGVTGSGVKVGVIDTGFTYDHPDLEGKIFGGINCTGGADGDYSDKINGHGISVASIIAARKSGKGVAGVAPDASLFIAKAIDDNGVGEAEYIKCSIEACIAAGCDVINMSLGSPESYPEVDVVIRSGVDKGIIFVAAAGNSGEDNDELEQEDWPARLPYVISVAAINKNSKRAGWSSRGDIEFSAPGVDIVTCFLENKYATFSGTSQAAPFVSGACALLKQCDKSIDYDRAVDLLSKHSLSIGAKTDFGAGIINLGSAVSALELVRRGTGGA
jgi:subtilisin family serine protease